MGTPKNIAFVIPALHGGGAERVVCAMANYWAGKGRDVSIITLAAPDEHISYPLSEKITLLPLSVLGKMKNALLDNIARIKALQRAFKTQKPEAIISFMESTNVLTLLAAMGLNIPVIISDRIDPKRYSYGRMWRALRNLTYPLATHFVVQTRAVLGHYPAYLRRRASVIPNFVALPSTTDRTAPRGKIICAMGRLNKQKGFDLLIEAFVKIAAQFPDWSLTIYGDGEERASLEKQADDAGLAARIILPGFSNAPDEIMRNAGIFVLSSRYEGFPNVLIEAMTSGAPVISTRCPCGPEEIINDGQNGLLIETGSSDALAVALTTLLHDEALCEKLGTAAKTVKDVYNQDHIMKLWDNILCAA